jgi:hypothetical protein
MKIKASSLVCLAAFVSTTLAIALPDQAKAKSPPSTQVIKCEGDSPNYNDGLR